MSVEQEKKGKEMSTMSGTARLQQQPPPPVLMGVIPSCTRDLQAEVQADLGEKEQASSPETTFTFDKCIQDNKDGYDESDSDRNAGNGGGSSSSISGSGSIQQRFRVHRRRHTAIFRGRPQLTNAEGISASSCSSSTTPLANHFLLDPAACAEVVGAENTLDIAVGSGETGRPAIGTTGEPVSVSVSDELPSDDTIALSCAAGSGVGYHYILNDNNDNSSNHHHYINPADNQDHEAVMAGISNNNSNNNNNSTTAFPNLDSPISANYRMPSSPIGPNAVNNHANGNGASSSVSGVASAGAASTYSNVLPVGHQQDLAYLYTQIQELGSLLRSNRDKVNVITRTAEEVARRANNGVTTTNGGDEHGTETTTMVTAVAAAAAREGDKAKIRELEHELAKANHLISLYKHEQVENTRLIAEYEEAMGTATEQVRNYCGGIESRYLRQRKHYNDLLQEEKDEHLASRLERDHWFAQTLKLAEMIRTAYRLRCDEWSEEYTVIAGLQTEVRCLRRCLGMEAEKPEEETGWPYLKDAPLEDQN